MSIKPDLIAGIKEVFPLGDPRHEAITQLANYERRRQEIAAINDPEEKLREMKKLTADMEACLQSLRNVNPRYN